MKGLKGQYPEIGFTFYRGTRCRQSGIRINISSKNTAFSVLESRTKFSTTSFFYNIFLGDFFFFCSYNIQHGFICRPSDSTVPTDAGIEPRTVATSALAVRRSNH
jgi:hypothetical protein